MSRTQVRRRSSNAIRGTISSLTSNNSSTVDQDDEDVPSSRPQLDVHIGPSTGRAIGDFGFISSLTSNASPVRQDHQYTLSSRTSQVYFGASSPTIGTRFSNYVSSIGASNSSSIVHRKYRYASSLWKEHLRHANSSRVLESPRASTCICLSKLVSVPAGLASSMYTSDDRAGLVIRVIECIAAHLPIDSEADKLVREQTLDFDSAG